MSQRNVVDIERAAELRRLRKKDPEAFRRAIEQDADDLLSTAEAYEEFRDEIERIVRRMQKVKGVPEQYFGFDKILEWLEDALASRVGQDVP